MAAIFPFHVSVPQTICEFLGFTESAASYITLHSLQRGAAESFQHLDFYYTISDYFESRREEIKALGENWPECLERLGINSRLAAAVTKSGFENIRHTRSVIDWVKLAMKMRWQHYKAHGGVALATQQSSVGVSTLPVQDVSPYRNNYIMWHPTTKDIAADIWRDFEWPHNVDLSALAIFEPQSSLLYTAKASHAQHFIEYVADQWAPAEPCLVRLSVPQLLVQRVRSVQHFFPAPLFKKVAFYSRQPEFLEQLPMEYVEADFTAGHASRIYGNTPSPAIRDWYDITSDNLVRIGLPGTAGSREPMVQYSVRELLAQEISMWYPYNISVRHHEHPDVVLYSSAMVSASIYSSSMG